MANPITVTVTVQNGGKTHTYQMENTGESKAGTFKLYQPAKDNPVLASFGKLYLDPKGLAKADKAPAKKS